MLWTEMNLGKKSTSRISALFALKACLDMESFSEMAAFLWNNSF